MSDPRDKIGTEPEFSDLWLTGWLVFCAAMLFALGLMLGWYLG